MWNALVVEQLAAEHRDDLLRAAAANRRRSVNRTRRIFGRLFTRPVDWSPRLWTHSIDTTRNCTAPRAMPW